MTAFWCETLVTPAGVERSVRIVAATDGSIASVETGVSPRTGDELLGTVLPGMGNAHSHAFHRALRGRTHGTESGDRGDFWRWRDAMYRVAGLLDPELYYELARAVFAEMLASGWTAVGEFHYVHHQPGGAPYPRAKTMELAVAAAAASVGIRLVLLDTVYLAGGIDAPLQPQQQRFSDGTAERWVERWHALGDELAGMPGVSLGAAVHSVRAVPLEAMTEIFAAIPVGTPVHVHLSEQPLENEDTVRHYGLTPLAVVEAAGGLRESLSVVHATHLTPADIARIGASSATSVFCPTTEADLGDGIGPARELHDSGSRIALGSDQNAVVDPFLEMRGLEAGERLRSGRRGRFSPAELLAAGSTNGYASLALGAHALRPGEPCDLIEVSTASVRTAGSLPAQLVMSATATDVARVVVGGHTVAHGGVLASGDDPATLLADSLARIGDHE